MDDITGIIHRLYKAVGAGDGAALTELISERLVYSIPGENRFAGVHNGRDEFFAIMQELGALSGGTLRNQLNEVFVGATGAVVLQQTTAQRDGVSYDMTDALVMKIEGGQLTEATEYTNDPETFDRLLA